MVWKWLFFLLLLLLFIPGKLRFFGNARFPSDMRVSSGEQRDRRTSSKKPNVTHVGDSVCLHTLTEEALASCCAGLHSGQRRPFLPSQHPPPLKTKQKNPCMFHSQEHSLSCTLLKDKPCKSQCPSLL